MNTTPAASTALDRIFAGCATDGERVLRFESVASRHFYRSSTRTARERQELDEELVTYLDRLRGGLEGTNEWYRLTSARSALTRRMMDRAARMARAAN